MNILHTDIEDFASLDAAIDAISQEEQRMGIQQAVFQR